MSQISVLFLLGPLGLGVVGGIPPPSGFCGGVGSIGGCGWAGGVAGGGVGTPVFGAGVSGGI